MLLQYGIDGQLVTAIKSLNMHSEVCVECVRVKKRNDQTFQSVGPRQGCLLSFTYSVPYLYGQSVFLSEAKKILQN